tara:strand:- start:2202 stop:4811 length:2610 start_codon:yes stop_codon:yes gene_type:complete
MKNFRDIVEVRGDIAVFTFGRFNPPTTGHEKLIDALAKQQSNNAGSAMYVYPSHSQNAKKDPLPHALKIAYMRKMFPKYKGNITVSKSRTALEAAVELHKKRHRSIVMVVGSDRVTEFNTLLNKYNGVDSKHGFYSFDDIKVVSAGERDPDAEGVSGMSASKMRAAASSGDFDSFKTGVPSTFKDSLKLYNDVRKNMGIREERDMGEMTDFETLRDLYLTGKLWNVGDIVESHGHEGKVINKGTNYLTFVSEDGKVHKTWLHDIVERDYKKEYANYQGTPEQIARRSSRNKARRIMGDKAVEGKDVGHKDNNPLNNDPSNLKMEDPSKNRREPRLREVKQDKEIKDKKGTQPAKYYSDMAKSTKDKRAAHFNKKKAGPAPGDASAKTKLSTHTKDFKKMYGEASIDEVRAKQAVNSRGKVQKLVTAHGLKFKGKVYKEIDMELVKINNSTEIVTFNIIHPKEIFGNEVKLPFKTIRRGPFMATDTSKINEVLGKDADMGDYIDDFEKSDSPQFKGKSKEKRKEMAIAAFLSKNEATDYGMIPKKNKKGHEVLGTGGPFAAGEELTTEAIEALTKKAKKTGMSYSILKKVYDRGMAAWKTGHRPGTTPQQWAFARVNSFATKSAGTWGKADADLAKQVRGESVEICCDDCVTEENPCWDGFKQVGMKTKGGKQVPNCVPEETEISEKTLGKMVFDAIYKISHPQEYDAVVKRYAELVRDNPQKTHSNAAATAVKQFKTKIDARALVAYINKLVVQKKLPKELAASFKVNQSESLNSWGEITETDKNSGKELNNPTKGDVKKYKVYVKNDKGNVVKVEFGDPNMEIKRDDPERRKAFRARHNCDQKKDKTTAGYWSCKFWSGKSVTDLMKG